jgi:hypothetical protein
MAHDLAVPTPLPRAHTQRPQPSQPRLCRHILWRFGALAHPRLLRRTPFNRGVPVQNLPWSSGAASCQMQSSICPLLSSCTSPTLSHAHPSVRNASHASSLTRRSPRLLRTPDQKRKTICEIGPLCPHRSRLARSAHRHTEWKGGRPLSSSSPRSCSPP